MRSIILVLATIGVLLVGSACATATRTPPRQLSVAIAVTPIGARSLSHEQVACVHEALIPEIRRAGYSVAKNRADADFMVLVNFTPVAGGSGGRVKITGLEPTAPFLRATEQGDTPEARELRRRQREIEQWMERQSRNSDA